MFVSEGDVYIEKQRDSGQALEGSYSSKAKWRNCPGRYLKGRPRDLNSKVYTPFILFLIETIKDLYFFTIAIFIFLKG